MKAANVLLLAALAAITTAAGATPSATDEARAEAAQRNAVAARAAALVPSEPKGSQVVRISDTDSARSAAGQANARQAHDKHLAEVMRAGAGTRPAPIKVTDTDSARAAAGQQIREQALLSEFAQYEQTQAQGPARQTVR